MSADGERSLRERIRASVARFRAKRRRFDYYPHPDLLTIIEAHIASRALDPTASGTLDRLILAGHKAITGNLQR